MDEIKVEAIAYDDVADWCYREINKDDIVIINGSLRKNIVEINTIEEKLR